MYIMNYREAVVLLLEKIIIVLSLKLSYAIKNQNPFESLTFS